MHLLDCRACTFVSVVEVPERVEVILGSQELLAFDSERLRDEKSFLGNLRIEREDGVELIGGQEIPVAYLATRKAADLGVLS